MVWPDQGLNPRPTTHHVLFFIKFHQNSLYHWSNKIIINPLKRRGYKNFNNPISIMKSKGRSLNWIANGGFVALIIWYLDLNYLWLCIQLFSPGTSVSSTNKTDRHDLTEILMKVALGTIKPNQTSKWGDFIPNGIIIIGIPLYFHVAQQCFSCYSYEIIFIHLNIYLSKKNLNSFFHIVGQLYCWRLCG